MGPLVGHLLAALCVGVLLGWVRGSVPNLGPAEQEQNHYLAQLFGLYGENGTLTARGLARLLHSLGLGRVQGIRLGHHGPPTGRVAPPSEDNLTHRLQDPELSVDVWAGMPLGSSGWGDLEDSKSPHLPQGPAPSGLDLFHRLLLLDHSLADHLNEDCLNGSQLLVNFGLSPAAPLTPRQFALLCPALLYQIDSRVCTQVPAPAPPGSLLPALLHSALAVLLLSLPAPLTLLLLRLLGPRLLQPLLGFLGALAVGTLCGDALLHLLPHAQGRQHAGPSGLLEKDLGPELSVLGGLFLLFILENVLGLFRHRGLRPEGYPPISEMLQTKEKGSWNTKPRPRRQHWNGSLAPAGSSRARGSGPEGTEQPLPTNISCSRAPRPQSRAPGWWRCQHHVDGPPGRWSAQPH